MIFFRISKPLTHKINAAVVADLKKHKNGKYQVYRALNIWAKFSALMLFAMIMGYLVLAAILQMKGHTLPQDATNSMARAIIIAAASYVITTIPRNGLFTELEHYIETKWNVQSR